MIQKATLDHLAKHLNSTSQIILRADFNVPIKNGLIEDMNRIKMTIPTINELARHNPKSIVILSHLGRPNGEKTAKHSLRPIVGPLEVLLNRKVNFLNDCVGPSVIEEINKSRGEIFLCENLRFHPEEEGSIKNKEGKKFKSMPEDVKAFRNSLSQLGNVYVNDAFGTAHRAHSSVVGINHQFRVAGRLMQRQLQTLTSLINNPKKPILVILGGSKVTDKIELIMNMLDIADDLIIGGGMAFPFLKCIQGHKLGATRVQMPSNIKVLQQILDKAEKKGVRIHFPVDGVCAKELTSPETYTYDNKDIPEDLKLFDKGPKSIELFDKVIHQANSIFWNGPLGVFEIPNFLKGSASLLTSIAKRTKEIGVTSLIGGGDTASLVYGLGFQREVTYISTGGGASLAFVQGIELPGITALTDRSAMI